MRQELAQGRLRLGTAILSAQQIGHVGRGVTMGRLNLRRAPQPAEGCPGVAGIAPDHPDVIEGLGVRRVERQRNCKKAIGASRIGGKETSDAHLTP
ncbi:MAG: hypothetical protein ACT60Q_21265, partial [Ferrovibrionaceae bacterium]